MSLRIVPAILAMAASVVFGLLYGVLLPMLPSVPRLHIPGSLAWGGIIFPLLWTGLGYSLMGVANPVLQGDAELVAADHGTAETAVRVLRHEAGFGRDLGDLPLAGSSPVAGQYVVSVVLTPHSSAH